MWDYSTTTIPTPYSNGLGLETYRKAVAFLDGPGVLEDWGCGTTYAKQFVKHARYVGVDGSPSAFNDVTADLTTYKSKADYILLRHVLEHNYRWKDILQNAIDSARYRLAVVLFTPLESTTTQLTFHEKEQVPDLSLGREDFYHLILQRRLVCAEECNNERIFYLA